MNMVSGRLQTHYFSTTGTEIEAGIVVITEVVGDDGDMVLRMKKNQDPLHQEKVVLLLPLLSL